MENDGTAFTVGETNLTAFLGGGGPSMPISPALVQSLYPGQNDSVVIADAFRDRVFRWYVRMEILGELAGSRSDA
jgi:hypothetical protein